MAREELDELLNMLFDRAKQLLETHGEFYPFAASMNVDGEVIPVAAATGNEFPATQDLIDLLTGALSKQAKQGEIRAAGICTDVRTIPPGQSAKSDAICAHLEHSAGEAVRVLLPYRKGWFGSVKYSEIFATRGERIIFAESERAT